MRVLPSRAQGRPLGEDGASSCHPRRAHPFEDVRARSLGPAIGCLVAAVALSGCLLAGDQSPPPTARPAALSPTRVGQATLAPTSVVATAPIARTTEPSPGSDRASPVSTPAAAASARYTVQSGDTLFGLARRFGVSVAEMASANAIPPDGGLRAGQTLALPSGSWSDELGIRLIQPQGGARVRAPISVQGSAATFEGSVVVEALAPDGARLARVTTQAKGPEVGTHGPFQVSLEIPTASSEQPVTIRLYWPSPRDGAPRDEVKVAVTVLPG